MQREFPSCPLIGVGAVVIQQDKVLIARRGNPPMQGLWTLPGGVLELGETLAAGVAREVREETGLLVEPVELIELFDRIHKQDDRIQFHYVIADYLCRVTGGVLQAASDADAVQWIERSAWSSSGDLAPGVVLDPVTVRVIEKAWQRAQALGL